MDRIYDEKEIENVAEEILRILDESKNKSNIIALKGDLGAGKTTLTKEIANLLGVEDTVISPTYVLVKFYETKNNKWKKLIHMDAYRIEGISELGNIGYEDFFDPENLVIIEWPEKIEEAIPKNATWFEIDHDDYMRHIRVLV